MFGTGSVPEVSSRSTAELINAAFTNAGEGVAFVCVSRKYCTKIAAAPDACGPAWLVPP